MNKGPGAGGKQPKIRDTVWNEQLQTMTLPDGRPKGAALVLEEKGNDINRPGGTGRVGQVMTRQKILAYCSKESS